MTGITSIPVKAADGSATDLSDHAGQVMLIVNVASKCGFTPQYAGLEALQRKYGERGFTVLGFPCNQFGRQDPGSNPDIAAFCERHYGVSFPMMARVEVRGPGALPLFRWLTARAPGLLGTRTSK